MTRDLKGIKQLNKDLLGLAVEGKIPAIISQRFPMKDAVLAMDSLLSRKTAGKIVLYNEF